jgi:phosphoribosyl 1,2-cyclic phosphodiesterase
MFRVTFWGVRGSYPVPSREVLAYGGNTTCVTVELAAASELDGALVILDAGTGLINLGRTLATDDAEPLTATLLFTHTHHDHLEGLPFFKPAYKASTQLYIFGPKSLSLDLKEILTHEMLPPYFPVTLEEMASTKTIADVSELDSIVLDIATRVPHVIRNDAAPPQPTDGTATISISRGTNHPGGGIFNYAIAYKGKRVVFATDVEGSPEANARLIEFARGADLLIHDSQYLDDEYNGPSSNKQGWGHSTVSMAVAVAKGAAVRELILFHHDPEHDDETVARIEAIAKKDFPNCRAAAEGLAIELD